MVGNAELAKEYNYRPQSKLSECQLDVNDQKAGRHKRTGFNFNSPAAAARAPFKPPPRSLCVASLLLALHHHSTASRPGGGSQTGLLKYRSCRCSMEGRRRGSIADSYKRV